MRLILNKDEIADMVKGWSGKNLPVNYTFKEAFLNEDNIEIEVEVAEHRPPRFPETVKEAKNQMKKLKGDSGEEPDDEWAI